MLRSVPVVAAVVPEVVVVVRVFVVRAGSKAALAMMCSRAEAARPRERYGARRVRDWM
jgi:hypothetical protein